MTDAAHLLSDVSGFGVSLFAAWYSARKSHTTHTFGYHRIEVRSGRCVMSAGEHAMRQRLHWTISISVISSLSVKTFVHQVLGALASVLSIWLVTGILVYEAIERVRNPVHVNGKGEAIAFAEMLNVLLAQQAWWFDSCILRQHMRMIR